MFSLVIERLRPAGFGWSGHPLRMLRLGWLVVAVLPLSVAHEFAAYRDTLSRARRAVAELVPDGAAKQAALAEMDRHLDGGR